ncbi:MAG: CDP-alcohol phosphatidyltransferase family protein [Bacteroidetes bacterium]|nr:MAG: CDP-alcohol phosphatidyltransferase family protein [Bacteroidota bacterium]
MGKVSETYKARDVEEIVDIYLYRPWGYALAVGAHKLRMTPNQISIIGMMVGVVSGLLFIPLNPWINVIGIFMWMLGQALDGADGQLARMANMKSRLGRMLDGISDAVKFASLYLSVGYRLYLATGEWWVWPVVVSAGLAHSYQSSLADFYRNAYLFFVEKPGTAEIESVVALTKDRAEMPWKGNFLEKLLLGGYIRYSKRQEEFAERSGGLIGLTTSYFGPDIPLELKAFYRSQNKSLLKYYNALTTNTRMIVFVFSWAVGNFWIFFAFDLVVLNILMFALMTVIQKKADVAVAAEIEKFKPTPDRE